jgi:ATP-dependent Lon protease
VLANVLQLLKLPDGTVKVLVEGVSRVQITDYLTNDDFFEARAEYDPEMPGDAATIEALLRTVTDEFESYAKVRKNIPEEALSAVAETTEPAKLADLVAGHLGIEVAQKQELLETLSVSERLEKVYGLMQGEMSVLQVEKKIKTRVKSQMEKHPARVLPERADEGHSEGAGRWRGWRGRDGRAGRAHRRDQAVQGGQAKRPKPSSRS